MGAAPPRQTEFVFIIPGESFEEQLQRALSACSEFGFPPIVDEALEILRRSPNPGLIISVITSSEGFVRFGLQAPQPRKDTVQQLCEMSGAGCTEKIMSFQEKIGGLSPHFVEFQYLVEGFGYGVYNEGFDVVFHYKLT